MQRLALLVLAALIGAGLTLGALRSPPAEAPQVQRLR